jgi:hypothetical protein
MRASTCFCFTVWGTGVNSSLATNCVGIGDAKDEVSAGSSRMAISCHLTASAVKSRSLHR